MINSDSIITIQDLIINEGLDFGFKNANEIRTEQALLYDAVQLFTEAFRRLIFATKGDIKKIFCNNAESWEYGTSLNNFIKSVSITS
jgi:hypothetical protein